MVKVKGFRATEVGRLRRPWGRINRRAPGICACACSNPPTDPPPAAAGMAKCRGGPHPSAEPPDKERAGNRPEASPARPRRRPRPGAAVHLGGAAAAAATRGSSGRGLCDATAEAEAGARSR